MKYAVKRKKYLFNLMIALYPWLSVYAVPGMAFLGINEIIGIVFAIVYFAHNRGKIRVRTIEKYYFIFIIYSLFETFCAAMMLRSSGSVADPINRMMRNGLQFILIAIIADELFDIYTFSRIYSLSALLFSGFLLLQKILFLGAGIVIPWLIPGLPLNYTIQNQQEYYAHYIGKYYHYGSGLRPTGGFSEPTTFACYVLPILAMILILKESNSTVWKENKFLMEAAAVAIVLAILSSTSATGMMGLALIWLIWFQKRSKHNSWSVIIVPAVVIFGTAMLVYLLNTNEQMQNLMVRLAEVDLTAGASSGNQRIIRGFAVWLKLPLYLQIFGTGFGNISQTLLSYKISTPFDPYYGSAYMNATAELLVSGGVVGFILFCIYFYYIIKGNMNIFELVAIFMLLMFSLNMLASADFVTIIILMKGLQVLNKGINCDENIKSRQQRKNF
jgi:hypothetical protein